MKKFSVLVPLVLAATLVIGCASAQKTAEPAPVQSSTNSPAGSNTAISPTRSLIIDWANRSLDVPPVPGETQFKAQVEAQRLAAERAHELELARVNGQTAAAVAAATPATQTQQAVYISGDRAAIAAGTKPLQPARSSGPDGVTSIEDNAFSENQVTSVVIPDSVTSIGYLAFDKNPLTSITIGKKVRVDTFPNGFDDFYSSQRSRAGTYTWDGKNWSRK